MAWDDEEQKKKRPVYNQNQQDAYKRMSQGATQSPPAFEKLKEFFTGKKKKKDESEE